MENTRKKMSVAQAKLTSEIVAKTTGGKAEEIFQDMVLNGLVSNGRGCYTEGQEYFNNKYNEFKSKTLQEMKKLGLELKNSKGQIVDIALNHKAIK